MFDPVNLSNLAEEGTLTAELEPRLGNTAHDFGKVREGFERPGRRRSAFLQRTRGRRVRLSASAAASQAYDGRKTQAGCIVGLHGSG